MTRQRRISLVEIGTNSLKMLVAREPTRKHSDTPWEVTHFASAVTRIGGGLGSTGRVGRRGLVDSVQAIDDFYARIGEVDARFAFATYALRRASNASAVKRRLERGLLCPLRIISGRAEAAFAYQSAATCKELKRRFTLLMDVGGGSTEVIFVERGDVCYARSLTMGALTLTENLVRHDPPGADDMTALRRHVDRRLTRAFEAAGARRVRAGDVDMVVSGGTATTLGRMVHPRQSAWIERDCCMTLYRKEISRVFDRAVSLELSARRRMPGMNPERADIMPAGMVVLIAALERLGKRSLLVNPAGVRRGVLMHVTQNDLRW